MDFLRLGFVALRRKADIERAIALADPIKTAIQRAMPELVPLVKSLVADFFPEQAVESTKNAVLFTCDVFWLQRALKILGFYNLDVDGWYGDGTKKAVLDFRAEHGLHPGDAWGATCGYILVELSKVPAQ